jgi:glutathione synthase
MRSWFVMDPLDKINVRGDSTYVTMREATDRGQVVFACTPDKLRARSGRVLALASEVRTTREAPYFHVSPPEDVDLGEFDVVWMRKDPPFDMTYVFATYLLDMVPRETLVVNDPAGLKLFNEKMWVQLGWPHFQPDTLITNDIAAIRAFVNGREGKSVIKPWDGNGGRGVVVTERGDRNLSSLAELLTMEGRAYAIVQAYVPEVEAGDKRILLFDGEPVGAMLRVPQAADHRANMHAGAQVVACDLGEADQRICAEIGPALRRHGMVFVGIDVIGDRLTEINVTSPTGIQEMNRLYGTRLEGDLLDRVERLAAARRRTA